MEKMWINQKNKNKTRKWRQQKKKKQTNTKRKKRKRERKEKDAPFLLFLEPLSKYTCIRLSFLEADRGVEN